jgi:hypothetical protein
MELSNLQFEYDDIEDRLLLRIAAVDETTEHELQAWLTRRFIGSLWTAVQRALAVQVNLVHPDAAHASAELIDMAHQSAITTLDSHGGFGSQFRGDLPFHSELATAFLVMEAKFHIAGEEPIRINLLPSSGSGIEIAFNETELHGFCTVLHKAVQEAGWDMPLQLESAWSSSGKTEKSETSYDAPVKNGARLLN